MLTQALLCAVLTKGQPSGSRQQLEETKKQLHLTLDPLELVNKTHEQRWPLLGGYFMDFEAYKKDSVVAYSILQELDSIAVAHYDEDLQREVDHMSRHFRTYSTGLSEQEKTQQAIANWQTYVSDGRDWEKFLTTFQVVYRCCMQNVEPEICFKAIAYGKRMYDSALRQARSKMDKLQLAQQKCDDPEFGVCRKCHGNIPMGRLLLMPQSLRCVRCASL